MRAIPTILSVAALSAALSAGTVWHSTAEASPADAVARHVQRGEVATDYSQFRRYGARRYYGRPYADRYYRRDRGRAAAGLLGGLAAGALIGGAIASQQAQAAAPVVDDATAYCMQRFQSYDPASGTYLGYDGLRHPCP
jgi:uncharacterized protein (DUF3084 family)